MSGILVAAASKQQLLTAKPDEELKNVLPAAPTATREFPVGDTLAMFVEVYDNDVKTPHKVSITTKVVADDGHAGGPPEGPGTGPLCAEGRGQVLGGQEPGDHLTRDPIHGAIGQ